MRARVLALLACLTAGCATHRSPEGSSLFIHRSQATYSDGATYDAPTTSDSGGARSSGSSTLQALPAPTPKSSDLPTLESTDASLAAALLALKQHPSAAAEMTVAAAYERLGVLDFAQKHFENALKFDSHLAAADEGLARVWRDLGLPQLGLPYAYRAVAFAPRSASAQNTIGTVLFSLGDPTAAQGHFERALALDPRAAYALNNLCYVAFIMGEGDPAVSRCTQALALDPSLVPARNNLALTYAAEGRSGDAATAFAQAAPGAEARFNMGIVHMARREYSDAVQEFAAGCHADPEVAGACKWALEAAKLAANPPKAIAK